jgi:hypothetical protein
MTDKKDRAGTGDGVDDDEEELDGDDKEEGALDDRGEERGDIALDEAGVPDRGSATFDESELEHDTVEGTLTEPAVAKSDRKCCTRWPKSNRCRIACPRSS